MSDPAPAIALVLDNEGSGYVYEDHGRGPSKWGITLETYRISHPDAKPMDIHILDLDAAAAFYKAEFWDRFHIGEINDQPIANKILDLAVNIGPERAIKILQRATGVTADGILGKITADTVNKTEPTELLGAVRSLAGEYYRGIAADNPVDARELSGWLARLAK